MMYCFVSFPYEHIVKCRRDESQMPEEQTYLIKSRVDVNVSLKYACGLD